MHKDLKDFNSLKNSNYDQKWYEKSWVVILSLIFIYPVGLALMWAFDKWKLWLRIVITAFFLIVYFASFGGNSETETVYKESDDTKDLKEELKITKAENKDLKSNIEEIENKNQNKTEEATEEKTTEEPSTEETTTEEAKTEEAKTEENESKSENKPTREYKNALNSAKNYQEILPMSKAGLFDQLTSSAGDQYPEDAAQYAIDNLKADYKENALKAAENYQDIMPMSDSELFDQLTSDAGDKYTNEEAQYAIDNLD